MKLARDVMQPDVICVPETMTVRELCELFSRNHIAGAPVLDAMDHLVGVVSVADVARFTAGWTGRLPDYHRDTAAGAREWRADLDDRADSTRVRDIMNPVVYQVAQDTPLVEVLDLLIAEEIHRVIVTHRGRVIGIITTTDLMRAFRSYLKARRTRLRG